MERKTYNLLNEPKNGEYYNLLDYAVTECTYFQLVLRDTIRLSLQGEDIVKNLSKFLIAKVRTAEWPGTTLINSEATVFKYLLNLEGASILKGSSTNLYQWQQPNLPEDLCILRADKTPWLVTIAHENEGFLTLSKTELSLLLKTLPIYRSILEKAS